MIENAAVEFGMAKGPFRLMDEIGLDTTLHAGWSMSSAFPDRIPISPLLVALIKSGRLGQKIGGGIFFLCRSVHRQGTVHFAAKSGQSPNPIRLQLKSSPAG